MIISNNVHNITVNNLGRILESILRSLECLNYVLSVNACIRKIKILCTTISNTNILPIVDKNNHNKI